MLDVLSHLWPEIGGGDLDIGFMVGIVASYNAVMGFVHGLLLIP
jgi:hypothetical protein